MKNIELTQNKVAIVDDADYPELSKYNWYASEEDGYFYAVRNSTQKKGNRHQIRMHRQILGLAYGDSRQTDHQNHNTLDNRRNNIRIVTSSQNSRNTKSHQDSTSRFKGVSWYKQLKKWRTDILVDKIPTYLGSYDDEEMAAMAYDLVARKVFGKFAYLNFGGF